MHPPARGSRWLEHDVGSGQWIPTFPNARYLFAETEWEHWDTNEDESGTALFWLTRFDPCRSRIVDLVDVDYQVCPEVCLEPTPGHTPGHVSVHMQSAGSEALITGDCIHHPVQMSRPDWCSSADVDQAQGRQTRESLLARYVDDEILIIGTHFATPTAGHIKHLDGGGYFEGFWLTNSPSRHVGNRYLRGLIEVRSAG